MRIAAITLIITAIPMALAAQEESAAKPPMYSVLYTFTGGADGANPGGDDTGLIRDRQGNLYGTTTAGGDISGCTGFVAGCGVAFELDRAGKESVLHTFTGPPDGAVSWAGVIRDEEGAIYGTTYGGGNPSLPGGTVFKLDPSGNETVLYSFTGGTDGNSPYGGVIRDEGGNLYGTTLGGGTFGQGVVFKLESDRTEAVLYNFTGGTDGGSPAAGLIRDEKGNLYGTTSFGGLAGCFGQGCGVVFKVDATGKQTLLYSFTGGTDGGQPFAGLVRDLEGNLYGTTAYGGDLTGAIFPGLGCGVVFKLDRNGKESVLHAFNCGTDGIISYGRLLWRDGNLYGTTLGGGDLSACGGTGCGVVFKVDRAGRETVLYSFTGAADGSYPYVGVIADEEGNLYGTTEQGGNLSACGGGGCGLVFKIRLHSDHDEDSAGEISGATTH